VNYATIQYEIASGVATITLNRPKKLNSFTLQMLKELNEVLAAAAKDKEVRCLVITGAGRAFCAGQDLESFKAEPTGDLVRKYYIPMILRVRSIEKPVLAAVNGIAAGAGCSLVLACDLVILSEKASLLQAFIKVGLVPDAGASYMLPRLIGYHKAMELALFGDKIDARQALELDLCNCVASEADFNDTVSRWSARLAAGPKAMGWVKRVISMGLNSSLEEVMESEAAYQELAAQTRDSEEGMAAFLAKREPKFIGA
jgi:2-(1,2-epoxy-1,2-dihydrophenyl)acetyl-CoA isomerase